MSSSTLHYDDGYLEAGPSSPRLPSHGFGHGIGEITYLLERTCSSDRPVLPQPEAGPSRLLYPTAPHGRAKVERSSRMSEDTTRVEREPDLQGQAEGSGEDNALPVPSPSPLPSTPGHDKPKRFTTRRSHSSPSLGPWQATPTSAMKRSWQPSPSAVAVGVDGKRGEGRMVGPGASPTKGKGKGKGREGEGVVDVERGLSELYLTHERERADAQAQGTLLVQPRSPSPTKARRPTTPIPSQPATRLDLTEIETPDAPHKGDTGTSASSTNRGWGSTIVGGALSAGVFGAALGLTAYRLLSNRSGSPVPSSETPMSDESNSPDRSAGTATSLLAEVFGHPSTLLNTTTTTTTTTTTAPSLPLSPTPADEGESLARSASVLRRANEPEPDPEPAPRASVEMPPPPAYEETERRDGASKGEWEEVEFDEHLLTPSSSRLSTLKSRSAYHLSYVYTRRKKPKSVRQRGPRGHPLSSSRSLPVIEIYDTSRPEVGLVSPLSADTSFQGRASPRPVSEGGTGQISQAGHVAQYGDRASLRGTEAGAGAGAGSAAEGEEEDGEEDNEMISRLDSMSARLSELIAEGKRALQVTPGLGTTPGWEDEAGLGSDTGPPSEGGLDTSSHGYGLGNHPVRSTGVEGGSKRSKSEKEREREIPLPLAPATGTRTGAVPNRNTNTNPSIRAGEGEAHEHQKASSEISEIGRRVSISRIPVRSKSVVGLGAGV